MVRTFGGSLADIVCFTNLLTEKSAALNLRNQEAKNVIRRKTNVMLKTAMVNQL